VAGFMTGSLSTLITDGMLPVTLQLSLSTRSAAELRPSSFDRRTPKEVRSSSRLWRDGTTITLLGTVTAIWTRHFNKQYECSACQAVFAMILLSGVFSLASIRCVHSLTQMTERPAEKIAHIQPSCFWKM
jgi:hypothetical protein